MPRCCQASTAVDPREVFLGLPSAIVTHIVQFPLEHLSRRKLRQILGGQLCSSCDFANLLAIGGPLLSQNLLADALPTCQ